VQPAQPGAPIRPGRGVALTGGFGPGFAGGAAIALAAGLSGLLVPGRTRRAAPQRRVTQSGAEEAAA
jgi:hypothetical protein